MILNQKSKDFLMSERLSNLSPKVSGNRKVKLKNKDRKVKVRVQKEQYSVPKNKLLSTHKKNQRGLLTGSFMVYVQVLQCLLDSIGKKELISNFDVASSIDEVQQMHNRFVTELGIEFGTKKYKAVTLYCVQLMEGHSDPEPVDRLSVGKKDKWPNTLGSLRPLFHQIRDAGPYRQVGDQVIRSLFAMQRVVEDFSEISLKDIEHRATVDQQLLDEYNEFVIQTYKEAGIEERSGLVDYKKGIRPPVAIDASGPNKVPKAESAGYESVLLQESKELFPHFEGLCGEVQAEAFLSGMIRIGDRWEHAYKSSVDKKPQDGKIFSVGKVDPSVTACLRKVTAVPDSGNKSRTVAIPDYWTQCLLAPFESKIVNTIKSLYPESSNIFDHSGGFDKLVASIQPGTASLDASSWTDTFSVKFQKAHVRYLFGTEFCDHWSRLVVHCKWQVKSSDKYVRYLTGQGMGTRGSFHIASLAYLSLMEHLMKKHYPELFSDLGHKRKFGHLFNQIGDDSWNQDPKGLVYKDLVEKAGLLINRSKSKFSTEENLCGEYVSRNLNYGRDVSRISLSLCRNVRKNIFYLNSLFEHIEERTTNFDWNRFLTTLRDIQHKNSGKKVYPDHIWLGFYRALIVDTIIQDDNMYSKLMIAMEQTLVKESDALPLKRLRDRVNQGDSKYWIFLKTTLIFQDCEYMYTQSERSLELTRDFYREFPFGMYTKFYEGEYWDDKIVSNISASRDLSLMYLGYIVKSKVEPELFKLSLGDSLPQDSLLDIFNAAKILQREVEVISRDAVFGKSFLKREMLSKYRVDRSYRIQKLYLAEERFDDRIMSDFVNTIPNLSAILELSEDIFHQIVGQVDVSYPTHGT